MLADAHISRIIRHQVDFGSRTHESEMRESIFHSQHIGARHERVR